MQSVALTTKGLFHGAVDLETRNDGTVQPWRLKLADKNLYHRDLHQMAGMPSGVRIVIKSNTSKLKLTTYPMYSTHPYDFDLVCDGQRIGCICKDPVTKIYDVDGKGGYQRRQ